MKISNRNNETRREAQARIEVGTTEMSAWLRWCMVFLFIVTLISVPLLQNEVEREEKILGDSLRVDRVLPSMELLGGTASVMNLLEGIGERMDAYAESLERDSRLNQELLPGITRGLTKYRIDPNEQMYLGVNGWMFYRPSVEYVTGPGFLEPATLRARELSESIESDPVTAIVDFRNRLAERGVELLVVPIPTKAMVYPEELSDAYESDHEGLQNISFSAFMGKLNEEDVHVLDVLPDLIKSKEIVEGAVYLGTDTHWSPEGMGVVATAIGDYIRTNDLIEINSSIAYKAKEQMEFRGSGDLERMLGQGGDEHFFLDLRMQNRIVYPRTAMPKKLFYPSGATWSLDTSAEILLLGDSFSRIFSDPALGWGRGMGLAEQLSFELGVSLDGIRINDQGAYAARQALSREVQSGSDRLNGKKLVIWEFAMRELSFGDWRTGYRYEPREVFTDVTGEVSTAPITATGVIQEITRPLAPEKTPYPNGLISIHLKGVESEDNSISLPDEVVVFVWGMRDHKHTAAAGFQPGQELTLELRRWLDVRESLGDFSRRDFDHLELLSLPAFFGESMLTGELVDIAGIKTDRRSLLSGEDVEGLLAERIRKSIKEVEITFLEDVSGVASIRKRDFGAIDGLDGWNMRRISLEALLSGTFWAPSDEKWHSRLVEPEALPAIVSYSELLRARGIELIVLPAPSKLFFYSSHVLDEEFYVDMEEAVRLDRKYFEFYRLLRERGVEVLDVYPLLRQRVLGPEVLLYSKGDHHWSSFGSREVARAIEDRLKEYEYLDVIPKRNYTILEETIIFEGGKIQLPSGMAAKNYDSLKQHGHSIDILAVREIGAGGSLRKFRPWRESPILLIGDSYITNLSTSSGQFGAGLRDHVSALLGFPIDSLGVSGGGANAVRMELAMDDGRLDGKKVVIWCFNNTDLVRSTNQDGWKIVPLPKALEE